MPGEELPQDRQKPLVRPQHLVDRLDPQRRGDAGAHPLETVARELLLDHPLPRVELEDPLDVALALVDEPEQRMPADVLDRERLRLVPGLAGRVLEVDGVHHVLAAALGRRVSEVDQAAGGDLAAPGVQQAVVDLVPLVRLGEAVLEPVPLDDRGLDQRGRGVGVELEQLGGRPAVVAQIETADHARGLSVPGLDDALEGMLGNPHLAPQAALDYPVAGVDAHREQLSAHPLELGNLLRREGVVRRVVPVGADLAVGMEGLAVDETLGGDDRAPVRAGLDPHPAHAYRS